MYAKKLKLIHFEQKSKNLHSKVKKEREGKENVSTSMVSMCPTICNQSPVTLVSAITQKS